jgi:capsular polysaccharide biosynthesis protein
MRSRIITLSVYAIKKLRLQSFFLDTPIGFTNTKEWIVNNSGISEARYIPLIKEQSIVEKPPIIIDRPVSKRFARYYNRKANEAFTAVIPRGKVFGEFSNIIITRDNFLLADVSREFGAQGGKRVEAFSIFHNRMRMPSRRFLPGKVAVISTCGSNNFHHWNFDIMPRLHLLKMAGVLEGIDYFIINNRGLAFQLEGLSYFKIDPNKIINSDGDSSFFLEAELLYVPSLPEELGTISSWVVSFLRGIFRSGSFGQSPVQTKKLFISRRNATTRKIVNADEVMTEIFSRGFMEFIPEDYSMQKTAEYFAESACLISVHGSGLSNLPFISENTKVLDIMAPYHQDPYYWMICNQRNSLYVALFAEGNHPGDEVDLVKMRIDHDLVIDITKLRKALDLIS